MERAIALFIVALPLSCAHRWKGLEQSTLAPNFDASSSACRCAPAKLYSNERTSVDSAGGGCVGGCGGKDFQLHKSGGIVQSIRVWYDAHVDKNSGLKAISMTYFNDLTVHTVGSPQKDSVSITFSPGETLKGDVIISGNGYGTRAGYIYFETTAGQKFEAGQNSHTKYYFNSGNGFISGIFGRSGADIDQLAFIFWKPIKSVQYIDIAYPTLDSVAKIKSPVMIASQDFCNDNDVVRRFAGESLETETTTGGDSCFTAEFSESFGASISVESGVPEIARATEEAHWEIGSTQTFENCQRFSKTIKRTLSFPSPSLQPHTRTSFQYTQWRGRLSNLPYTATLRIQFQDGTAITRSDKGTYRGTDYMSVQQSWTKSEKNVTHCSQGSMV